MHFPQIRRHRPILTVLSIFCAAVALLSPAVARAQISEQRPSDEGGSGKRRLPLLGLDVNYLRFSQDRARSRFGNAFGFGLGFGGFQRAQQKGDIAPVFDFLTASRSDSSVLLLPVGVGYRRGLTADAQQIQPYFGASAEFVGTYIGSRPDDVKWGFRPAYGGSAFVGINYQNRGFLEARYRAISKVRGFDFSGVQLGAGVRF